MAIRILDVGECGMDGPRMAKLWTSELGAKVTRVNSGDEALNKLGSDDFDIVLVNRVLANDGSSGLEVIRSIVESGKDVPVMLVSDLPDAQDEAVSLGAVRGFGKAELESKATIDLVERVATGKGD